MNYYSLSEDRDVCCVLLSDSYRDGLSRCGGSVTLILGLDPGIPVCAQHATCLPWPSRLPTSAWAEADADGSRRYYPNGRPLGTSAADPIPKPIADLFEGRSFARFSAAIDTKTNESGRREATETVHYREVVFPPFVFVPIMSVGAGATGSVSVTDGTGTRTAKIEDGKVGAFTTVAQKGWTNVGGASIPPEPPLDVRDPFIAHVRAKMAGLRDALDLDGLQPGQIFRVKVDGLPVKVDNSDFASFFNSSLGEPFNDSTPIPAVPKTPKSPIDALLDVGVTSEAKILAAFTKAFESVRPDADVAYTTADGKTRTVTPTTGVVSTWHTDKGPVPATPSTLKRPCTACSLVEARYFPVYSGALCHACARAKLPPLEAAPRRWPRIVAAVVGAAAAVGGAVAAWGGALP